MIQILRPQNALKIHKFGENTPLNTCYIPKHMLNVKVCKKLGFFVTRNTRYINTGFIVISKEELATLYDLKTLRL